LRSATLGHLATTCFGGIVAKLAGTQPAAAEDRTERVDNTNTIVIKVPPTAAHLAVLRTAVGGVAVRDSFSLDQVNDLRLAVEEAATHLLHHVRKGLIEMTLSLTPAGLTVRLRAEVDMPGTIIDESSLSWMILRALTDEVRVESQQSGITVVLVAHRLLIRQDTE
jgi:serine/threonine-protein kinase RsbW